MIMSDRVRERMAQRGLSQAELARRVQITQGAIAKIVSNNPGGSSHLHKIARELGTSPAYLTGETDNPSEGALPMPTPETMAEQLDLVAIEEIDLAYGLGGTFTDQHVELTIHHFPRLWVETISRAPAALLTIARGRGDSMEPTIKDGDMVIINRAERTIREQDALWAFTIGDIGMIKRVRIRGERVTILSDNDRVPPDEAHVGEINVVGRIDFVGSRK